MLAFCHEGVNYESLLGSKTNANEQLHHKAIVASLSMSNMGWI